MSPVEFNRMLRRPVRFKGQGPHTCPSVCSLLSLVALSISILSPKDRCTLAVCMVAGFVEVI